MSGPISPTLLHKRSSLEYNVDPDQLASEEAYIVFNFKSL